MLQLPEAIARPSARQLRQFAVALPLAVLLVCWGLGFSVFQIWSTCSVGVALALIGWIYPPGIKPLYVALSVLAFPVGMLVSELVMLAVYFGLVTPIGIAFRCMGRDALERAIDRDASSYWRVKKQADSMSDYLRRW